jgi:hypothetical protein
VTFCGAAAGAAAGSAPPESSISVTLVMKTARPVRCWILVMAVSLVSVGGGICPMGHEGAAQVK